MITQNSYISSMANCVLPEDVMLCILTRLPVKTILRFKSVCKPWRDLFSTPEFRKLHHGQFSSDPKNQSFIVHSFRKNSSHPKNQFFNVHSFRKKCSHPENQFSIFKIESCKKKATIVDNPVAHTQNTDLVTVGCCNGLVCAYSGLDIVLWNPAMKLFKTVPIKKCGLFEMVSLGFGYDVAGVDFKVVRIVGEKRGIYDRKGTSVKSVEIYSVSLDSWIAVNTSFQFSGFDSRNDLIVNGNPHWVACVDGNMGYVCFDVMELVFKFVPLPSRIWNLDKETYLECWNTAVDFVDWNGALGSVSYINNDFVNRVDSLCVRVFNDGERVWTKKYTFEPIEEVNVCRFYHFTKNEKLLGCSRTGWLSTGELFVLDLETGSVNKLFDGACEHDSFEVYEYTESLAFIKGMKKCG